MPRGTVVAPCFFRQHSPRAKNNLESAPRTESLLVELVVPDTVERDSRVPVSMTIRNPTAHPIDLYLRGRDPVFDIVVRRPDGSIAWQRLADEVIQAVLSIRPLLPGDSFRVSAEWLPTDRGEVSVTGRILTESPLLECARRVIVT